MSSRKRRTSAFDKIEYLFWATSHDVVLRPLAGLWRLFTWDCVPLPTIFEDALRETEECAWPTTEDEHNLIRAALAVRSGMDVDYEVKISGEGVGQVAHFKNG